MAKEKAKPPKAKPAKKAKPDRIALPVGLRFYAPESLAQLQAALAWLDEAQLAACDDYGVDPSAWTVRALPSPRLHPHAPALFAAAAIVSPSAIAAVLDRSAYVDDDGELRIWPWYPEEDGVARPVAESRARALGLGMPREHLDEPYEPAHYFRRATSQALVAWLAGRGIDAAAARIDRLPMPPRTQFKDTKYEGGMSAAAFEAQAIYQILQTTRLFEYVGDNDQQRAHLEAKLDRQLAFACDRIANVEPLRDDGAGEPEPIELPHPDEEKRPIGRVGEIYAMSRGALIVTDGALIAIDRKGVLLGVWPRPMGDVFAIGDLVLVNYSHALDVAAGRFVEGKLEDILRSMGLDGAPSTYGHDERTAPVISGCGRYLLDVDETPYVLRLRDKTTVGQGSVLEKALEPPTKPQKGLVDPDDVAVGRVTVLDGVRFTLRSGESPVRDGRSLAFALAGDRWRFLTGDAIRDGSKTIARLGITVHAGAFRADGGELWALASDHAIRVDLGKAPKVGAIVPIDELLRAAASSLEVTA